MEYLQYGNIINSVNLPNASSSMSTPYRVTVLHENKPKMISQITDALANENANIENLINKSRKEIAYTILDVDGKVSDDALNKIKNISGVVRVQTYEQ
jgi:D-3-phosphoglycerate dehydrogenase